MPGSASWENSPINPALWRPHYSLTSPGLCLPSHLPVGKHPIMLEVQEFSSGKSTHTSSKRTEGYIFYPNVVRGSGALARAKVPTDSPGSSVACPTAPQTPSWEARQTRVANSQSRKASPARKPIWLHGFLNGNQGGRREVKSQRGHAPRWGLGLIRGSNVRSTRLHFFRATQPVD